MKRKYNVRNSRRRSVRRRGGAIRSIVRRYRRRYRKKSSFAMMRSVQQRSGFHYAQAVTSLGNIAPATASGTNPVYAVGTFTLNNIASNDATLSNIATMYEFYRCRKAVLIIRPLFTNIQLASSGSPALKVMSISNKMGTSTPGVGSSVYTAWGTGPGYKETYNARRHVRVWKPAPTGPIPQVPGSSTFTQVPLRYCPWLSISNQSVALYGPLISVLIENGQYATTGQTAYALELKTYWVFKTYIVS